VEQNIVRRVLENKGTALVEFSIVAILLLVLAFGIIEMGFLMKDYLTLNQAAREGARSAALGWTTTLITQRVQSAAVGMTVPAGDIHMVKWPEDSTPPADWSTWLTLGNGAAYNDASAGDHVRIHIAYQHRWVTRIISSSPIEIKADMVMRRE
jgi:Flp pilus assembly protein CpaB